MYKAITVFGMLILSPLLQEAAASDKPLWIISPCTKHVLIAADKKEIEVPLEATILYSGFLKELHDVEQALSHEFGVTTEAVTTDLSPFNISSNALTLLARLMRTVYFKRFSNPSSKPIAQEMEPPALDTIIELLNQSEILQLKPIILDLLAYFVITKYPGSLKDLALLCPPGKSAIAKQLYLTLPKGKVPEEWQNDTHDIVFGVSTQDLIDHCKLPWRNDNSYIFISLYINNLAGLVSYTIEQLFLNQNRIESIERTDLVGRFPKLRELFLHKNKIQSVAQHSFKYLPHLTFLQLSHNQIQSIEKDTFTGLTKLTALNLSHNRIRSIAPGAFQDLTHLEYLYLNNNPIENNPAERERIEKEIRSASPGAKIFFSENP